MENTETVLPSEPVSNEVLATIAKALAHPARVQIVRFLLSRSRCIGGEITQELGLAQSTVSEHLRILKAAGVVAGEIEHPRICYSLSVQRLAPLSEFLTTIGHQYQMSAQKDGLCCPLEPSDRCN